MKTNCNHCGQKYEIEFSQIGSEVTCQKCGQVFNAECILEKEGETVSHSNAQERQSMSTLVQNTKAAASLQGATEKISVKTIPLEGASTPDIVLEENEEKLVDLHQGVRDLGLLGVICSHKGRLLATNKRIIYFKKKTKDFEIQQMNICHAGFVSLGYLLNFRVVLIAALLVLLGLFTMFQADLIFGLVLGLVGAISLLFARKRSLVISGSGEKINFVTKSIDSSELAKVVLAISSNS